MVSTLMAHPGLRGLAAKGLLVRTADEVEIDAEDQFFARDALALGITALDQALPARGLPRGCVVELRAHGSSGAATSFALSACRAAQLARREGTPASGARREGTPASGARQGGGPGDLEPSWCAFIDPAATLFAPGAARLGVSLERLLVVRPAPDSIERVAIRIAESHTCSLLVIDATADGAGPSQQRWQRTVRKLSLLVESSPTCVLLLTSAESHRTLSLPVATRLELRRATREHFELRVDKDRSGRGSPGRLVPFQALLKSVEDDANASVSRGTAPRHSAPRHSAPRLAAVP